MLIPSEAWKLAYPGAAVGVLGIRNAASPARHAELDRLTDELERGLRARFADRNALRALPAMQAYEA